MRAVAICAVLAVAAACSGDAAPTAGSTGTVATDTDSTSTGSAGTAPTASDGAPTTVPPDTTPRAGGPDATDAVSQNAPVGGEASPASAFPLTEELADDLLAGRDNGTIGSELARQVLVDELSTFAEPLAGYDTFEHPFDVGTNVVAVAPGTDLADEYVVVGAHYDHLGENCRYPTADDVVCNGAADNAAGVAVAVETARAVAATEPRRSVVVALWDAEEDGLLGSRAFVADPPLPLDQVVAYVNLDLLGASLLPALERHTLVIGAETGGPAFRDAAADAVGEAGLVPVTLSVAFGQGRSDHAPFAAAGVPVVFFSDSTNGCYHTVDDEIDRIDVDKLDRELAAVTDVVASLADDGSTPEWTEGPFITYGDAVALQEMVSAGEPDLDLLGAAAAEVTAFLRALDRLVDDGPDAFDGTDANTVAAGAGLLVEALGTQDCRP